MAGIGPGRPGHGGDVAVDHRIDRTVPGGVDADLVSGLVGDVDHLGEFGRPFFIRGAMDHHDPVAAVLVGLAEPGRLVVGRDAVGIEFDPRHPEHLRIHHAARVPSGDRRPGGVGRAAARQQHGEAGIEAAGLCLVPIEPDRHGVETGLGGAGDAAGQHGQDAGINGLDPFLRRRRRDRSPHQTGRALEQDAGRLAVRVLDDDPGVRRHRRAGDLRGLESQRVDPDGMPREFGQQHRVVGRGLIEILARRGAALGEVRLVPAPSLNPLARLPGRGGLPDGGHDIGDRLHLGIREVEGERRQALAPYGGVEVGIVDAGQHRHAAEIDRTGAPAAGGPALQTYGAAVGSLGLGGVTPRNYGNPDLKPEVGQEIEVGFDAGLFKQKIGIEFTFYNKDINDAIISAPLKPSRGFPGVQFLNIGKTRNRGIEVALDGAPVNKKSWGLDLRGTIATNASTILSLKK